MTTETNTTAATKCPDAVAKGAYKSRSTGKRVAKDGTVSEAKREPRGATTLAPAGMGKDANKSKAQRGLKKSAPSTPVAMGNTFTTVDLAAQHGINPKTLRARIRRNIDRWSPLFKDGEKHVFADNATTRKAVAALLDA